MLTIVDPTKYWMKLDVRLFIQGRTSMLQIEEQVKALDDPEAFA
jgi:hypothetical protein